MCYEMTKINLFKNFEKKKFRRHLGTDFTDFVGRRSVNRPTFCEKKHGLSPCLGTSPLVGWFCSKKHTKNNGSKSCIFATLVGKGLKAQNKGRRFFY